MATGYIDITSELLGLVDQIRKGIFKESENILFIHTGGIFGLFPKKALFF